MKVYGFDLSDIQRGDLKAADVPGRDYREFPGSLLRELDWEYIDAAFTRTRTELIKRMTDENVHNDLITTVRYMRASYVSVSEVIDA